MLKRKHFLAIVLVLLYVGTWVGGYLSHARQLRDRAEAEYRAGEYDNQQWAAEARKTGSEFHPIRLREGGPASEVNWSVPVLPGILLVDSAWYVGPLWAKGGVKVVLYYGFGSTELCLLCWIA